MYDVLMIDPPWPKQKGGRRKVRPNQGRTLDYSTMSIAAIFELLDDKIFSLAAPEHSVFMWTVDQFLMDTEREMGERGYRRHARIVWDKTNGVAPASSVRYSHEYLIWYYKGKFKTPTCRGELTTVWREPARQHSRKPDLAYNNVKRLYPQATAIDVFSRERRDGWDQWGDQVDHF